MKHDMKKYKGWITLAACAVIGVGIIGTYAILTAQTNDVVNSFKQEEINTHIKEDIPEDQEVKPDTSLDKDVKIVNDGPDDAFIRARVTISPEGAATLIGMDEAWQKYSDDDDWYYYTKVVPNVKGEDDKTIEEKSCTTSLFTQVHTSKGLNENFDVTVYQEAVGTGKYTVDDGQIAVEEIKKYFDAVDSEN